MKKLILPFTVLVVITAIVAVMLKNKSQKSIIPSEEVEYSDTRILYDPGSVYVYRMHVDEEDCLKNISRWQILLLIDKNDLSKFITFYKTPSKHSLLNFNKQFSKTKSKKDNQREIIGVVFYQITYVNRNCSLSVCFDITTDYLRVCKIKNSDNNILSFLEIGPKFTKKIKEDHGIELNYPTGAFPHVLGSHGLLPAISFSNKAIKNGQLVFKVEKETVYKPSTYIQLHSANIGCIATLYTPNVECCVQLSFPDYPRYSPSLVLSLFIPPLPTESDQQANYIYNKESLLLKDGKFYNSNKTR